MWATSTSSSSTPAYLIGVGFDNLLVVNNLPA